MVVSVEVVYAKWFMFAGMSANPPTPSILLPRALGRVAGAVEQRARARAAAIRLRRPVCRGSPRVPGDPDGEARGAQAITAIAVKPIRGLARVEDHSAR